MRWNYKLSANHLSKFMCIWNENVDVENLVWKAWKGGGKEKKKKRKVSLTLASMIFYLLPSFHIFESYFFLFKTVEWITL